MPQTIPLIRAASMIPFLRWTKDNHRPTEALLASVDLANLPYMKPYQPIALINAFRFLHNLAELEGPDIGCRVVSSSSLLELALIGKVALGARTPREALVRVAGALPYHCSHERMTVWREGQMTTVRDVMPVKVSKEAAHIQQQYLASILQILCELGSGARPVFKQIAMIPHPDHGLIHLKPFLKSTIVASKTGAVAIEVPNAVLDSPFPTRARDRTGGSIPSGVQKLHFDGRVSETARPILKYMLDGGQPSIESLAVAAGVSTRTLQRRLMQEGTSFTGLLDDVREQLALEQLANGGASMGSIAATLGYSGQGALTRAVRRWKGDAPKQIRRKLQA